VPREVIVGDEDVHGYALVENRNALYFDFFMILWMERGGVEGF
jgi:hypothetical protein